MLFQNDMTSNGDADAKQSNKPQQNDNSIQNGGTMMQGPSSIRKHRNGMTLKRFRSTETISGSYLSIFWNTIFAFKWFSELFFEFFELDRLAPEEGETKWNAKWTTAQKYSCHAE